MVVIIKLAMIDSILQFNKQFVASKGYEPYVTDKFPAKKLAVYELGVEEVMVVAHTDCGACNMSFGHFRKEMLKRGIPEAELQRTDVDLNRWLEGFHDTQASVRVTVSTIVHHPLMPKDVTVRGFIMETVTGELTEVES